MSSRATALVWNIEGLTPRGKLGLLFVADTAYLNQDGCLIIPAPDYALLSRFLGNAKDFEPCDWALGELERVGLVRCVAGEGADDCEFEIVPPGHVCKEWIAERERSFRITTEVRLAVLARDGGRCRFCGCAEDLTLDHVFPQVLGGDSHPANLQVLCRSCNSRKGARLPAGWL